VPTLVRVSSEARGDPAAVGELFDGDPRTAWCARRGERGTFIEVELPEQVSLVGLEMITVPGPGETSAVPRDRVSRVTVSRRTPRSADDGADSQGASIPLVDHRLDPDAAGPVSMPLAGPGGTISIGLELDPSTRRRAERRQVCVSELRVLGRPDVGGPRPTAGLPIEETTPLVELAANATSTVAEQALEAWVGSAGGDESVTLTEPSPPVEVELAPGVASLVPLSLDEGPCYTVVVAFAPRAPAAAARLGLRARMTTDSGTYENEHRRGWGPAGSAVLGLDRPICPELGDTFELDLRSRVAGVASVSVFRRAERAPHDVAPDRAMTPGVDPALGPELIEAEGLRLLGLVVALRVEDDAPLGERQEFSRVLHPRVHCVARVESTVDSATEVTVEWEALANERVVRDPELHPIAGLGESVVTDWLSTRRLAGRYRCVVRSAAGDALGRVAFDLID
jgi:hypothetical protein